ncbi:MAG: sodium-translocating pyrophosphatase [Myxococcales bacterium]|nr:sodium-translocating pyrophosphatase [Myxococcales bacterium]
MHHLLGLLAQSTPHSGGEASVALPRFDQEGVRFAGGFTGSAVLSVGLVVCVLGVLFGLALVRQLSAMPVHPKMRSVSELIYETCKSYLRTQGRYILVLEAFIAVVVLAYFGLIEGLGPLKLVAIVVFSLLGIAGSFGVSWLGIRVNNYANSRAAFASLEGKPFPVYAIPLRAGMSIGTLLISVALLCNLVILLFMPRDYAGPCMIGFAIGESLGASALRIAGGIFTKIADIGSDLMKIVFNIKEDDARNPGVIADCAGDNAGDSVGPTADGFETYGVTSVALIVFITKAIDDTTVQVQLLTWIFAVAIAMIPASIGSYLANEVYQRATHGQAKKMNYEAPLTTLVRLTAVVSIALTFFLSWLLIPNVGGDKQLWWQLASIMSLGTLAGAVIPEVIKVFTSTESAHVEEIVEASDRGGASLNVLAGLIAGNFSAFWMGLVFIALMGAAWLFSGMGLKELVPLADGSAATVFAFGLVAFGFLSMGPVTIAVDSYGPVTDNAQSVYELSLIESEPGIEASIEKEFGFTPDFEMAKYFLEANDGAGNTFKATAKPVLIGTAVVGATTMVFSIILDLTDRLNTEKLRYLAITNPPFLLGLVMGGAVMFWFAGAATQAVSTGAYRAVEFISNNIRLETDKPASVEDSKRVVEICTRYAQAGMTNIFFAVFLMTLAFAFVDAFFFVGYLISMAIFGLYQSLFMANAGGAWDNAKKLVEVELKMKGTPLHAACVVGDTVGDPYKDTSSVAMNPVIKFTTLFGLLAAGLGHSMSRTDGGALFAKVLAAMFFAGALVFVWRSFYRMRIRSDQKGAEASAAMPTPYRSEAAGAPVATTPPAAVAPIVAAAAAGAVAATAVVAAAEAAPTAASDEKRGASEPSGDEDSASSEQPSSDAT